MFYLAFICLITSPRSGTGVLVSDDAERAHEVEHGVAYDNADDAHDDANAGHVVLVNQVGGVGQGIWGRGDGQDHSARCCDGHTDEYGRRAADGSQLVAHGRADHGEDGHEQSCGGRVRDEVGETVADEA